MKRAYLGSIFSFKQVWLNRIEFLLFQSFSFFCQESLCFLFFFMLQSWNLLIISPKELFVFYQVLLVLVRTIVKVTCMLLLNLICLIFKLNYHFIFVFITKVKLVFITKGMRSCSGSLFLNISITASRIKFVQSFVIWIVQF